MRILCVLLVLGMALFAGPEARAHAQLRNAQPEAGSVQPVAPGHVRLFFNEPVQPLVLSWVHPDGRIQAADVHVDGEVLVVPFADGALPGTYLLSWRVVSADTHPVGGIYSLSIGTPTMPTAQTSSDTGSARLAALGRFALTLCLCFAAGGAFFLSFIAADAKPHQAVALTRVAVLLLAPVGIVALGGQGLDLAGRPVVDVLSAEVWRSVVVSPFLGTVILAGLAGLVAWRSQGGIAPRTNAGLSILLAGASYMLSGHAASAPPQWLTSPMVALHASLAIVWVGALPGLFAVLREKPANAALAMRRFSRAAFLPLVALLLGGAILSVIQLEEPQALWRTDYGRLIAAKIMFVAAMLALALCNRFILTPRLAASDGAAPVWMRRSIAMEIILGIAVLALVSGTRVTPPARAMASADAQELHVHLHGDRVMADLKLLPGRVGSNVIEITVLDGDFRSLTPLEITILVSRSKDGIEPQSLRAQRGSDDIWRAEGLFLPLAGEWRITIDILIDDFRKVTLQDSIILDR